MTATCAIFDPRPTPYYDQNGLVAAGAQAFFYLANTTTPLTVYSDQDLLTPHSWPVLADAKGVLPPIYMSFTDYRVIIKSADGVSLWDAPLVPNPAPPSAGGGGITVDATQIFATGDTIWRLRTGSIYGFVRMNGRTIGSASSGATEYAGLDVEDLFAFLWENLPQGIAAVSGGSRGASASADWAANKTIVVPSMQGRAPFGLDDMGGGAAGNLQVVTTASVTNGLATATVSSATGLAKGMNVMIDGASAGTISNIVGTTITLSGNYGGLTNAAASFRASWFADAQAIGGAAGAQTVTQTTSEMPQHNHGVTDPGHTHTINPFVGGSMTGGPFGVWQNTAGAGNNVTTSNQTTGITINNSGSGLPMQSLPPARLGTFYMKI